MRKLSLLLLLFCCGKSSYSEAHTPKRGDVWSNSSLAVYRTYSTHSKVDQPLQLGGGFAAEGDVDFNGGVEIGMFYIDKLYIRKSSADLIAEQIQRMYVTMGYRHWFQPALSAGFAFFSSYSMGDPKVVFDQRPSGAKLETSARKITEYGFDVSLQWEIWSNGSLGLITDLRLSKSMSRKPHEDAEQYGLLLGVKHLFPKSG